MQNSFIIIALTILTGLMNVYYKESRIISKNYFKDAQTIQNDPNSLEENRVVKEIILRATVTVRHT